MSFLNDYAEETSNMTLKEGLQKLTTPEKIQVSKMVGELIEKNRDAAVDRLREEVGRQQELLTELQECQKSLDIAEVKYFFVKGFYDAVNNEATIEWGGENSKTMLSSNTFEVKEDYLRGIKAGIDYLIHKPDQIIQHYQDPNPKEKVYQHRKDKD